MSSLSLQSGSKRARLIPQDFALFGLRLTGWLATTTLATLGMFAVFFIVLGGFTLDGTMRHLGNLTARWLAADLARREQFQAIAFGAVLIGFVLFGFFRRASLISAFDVSGDDQ